MGTFSTRPCAGSRRGGRCAFPRHNLGYARPTPRWARVVVSLVTTGRSGAIPTSPPRRTSPNPLCVHAPPPRCYLASETLKPAGDATIAELALRPALVRTKLDFALEGFVLSREAMRCTPKPLSNTSTPSTFFADSLGLPRVLLLTPIGFTASDSARGSAFPRSKLCPCSTPKTPKVAFIPKNLVCQCRYRLIERGSLLCHSIGDTMHLIQRLSRGVTSLWIGIRPFAVFPGVGPHRTSNP